LAGPENHPCNPGPSDCADLVIAATTQWLERAVIGLQLCPFAASAALNGRVRYVVSEQDSSEGLIADLTQELLTLHAADPAVCETTLLIIPRALTDFLTYNNFLDEGDRTLDALDLVGELQIASFHPRYQFAGTAVDAIENFTNRSPYPMLHLLREDSVTRVAGLPGVDAISRHNIGTLRKLGLAGWQRLWLEPTDADPPPGN
jgi:hypothetical protein